MVLLAMLCAPLRADPGLREVSNIVWRHEAPWFGGFSAIEVSGNGSGALAITDRGSLVRASFEREGERLSVVRVTDRQPFRYRNGSLLRGPERDAEGLAVGPDGRAYISFEFRDHVAQLDLRDGTKRLLPVHGDFAGFPHNQGLEALAVHPDGRLFALSENRADQSGTIPVYTFGGGRWQIAYRLAHSGGHVPVGADFDAQGKLYLLERLVTPLGFSSRISRIDLTREHAGAVTLLTTAPGTYGNLEGLSVWTDKTGATRLTLIADDNFLPLLQTRIVEFLVTE